MPLTAQLNQVLEADDAGAFDISTPTEAIQELAAMLSVTVAEAENLLASHGGNIHEAAEAFFTNPSSS